MITMDDAIAGLVRDGKITRQMAAAFAQDGETIESKF